MYLLNWSRADPVPADPIAFAGSTYPLDLVRSRLSIATASIPLQSPVVSSSTAQPALASAYHTASTSVPRPAAAPFFSAQDLTVWGMTMRVMRDEGGVRALYRGLVPTAMGVAPYVGKYRIHNMMNRETDRVDPFQASTSLLTRRCEDISHLLGRAACTGSCYAERWRVRVAVMHC